MLSLDLDAESAAERAEALAARFNQAANELQAMGMIRWAPGHMGVPVRRGTQRHAVSLHCI